MIPDFIIGGAPKSATTALFDYLAQHPKIVVSDPKEPHYFASSALGHPVMQGDFSRTGYQSLFADKRSGQVAGEGSTHYLCHAEAVAPLMAAEVPDVRLVFCLREPVARAYSHFLFRYSTAGPYDAGGVGWLDDFSAFVRDPEIFAMGDYATGLEIFGKHFSTEQILILFFEDIIREPAKCLADICTHIGVDPGFEFDASERSNVTVYPRHPEWMPVIDKTTTAIYPRVPRAFRQGILRARKSLFFSEAAEKKRLSATDRTEAKALYRPSVEKLAEMTARDLTCWL